MSSDLANRPADVRFIPAGIGTNTNWMCFGCQKAKPQRNSKGVGLFKRCADCIEEKAHPKPKPTDQFLPAISPIERPSLNTKQLNRMAFRVWLFQEHGWDENRAGRWADKLHDRDMEKDDRRLCVECKHLTSSWGCMKGGDVVADLLQRCPTFEFEVPKQKKAA